MQVSERIAVVGPGPARLLAVACAVLLAGSLLALGTVGATRSGADGSDAFPPATGSDGGDGPGPGKPGGAPDPQADGAAAAAGPGGSATATTLPLAAPSKHGWDFAATLTPTCGPIGATFTLTVGLGPNGRSSIAVMYATGESGGTRSFGEGGPDGTFTLTWVAAAAPGDATVIIAASDAGGANGGTKALPFRVVAAAARC